MAGDPQRAHDDAMEEAEQEYFQEGGLYSLLLQGYYAAFALLLLELFQGVDTQLVTARRAEYLGRYAREQLRLFAGRVYDLLSGTNGALVRVTGQVARAYQAAGAAAANAAGADVPPGANLELTPSRVERLVVGRRDATGLSYTSRTLLEARTGAVGGEIGRYLAAASDRQMTERQAVTRIAQVMGRDSVNVVAALEQLGADGGRLSRFIARGRVEPAAGEDLKEARQLLHTARRVFVHETNLARQAAGLLAAYDSPFVGHVRWAVSHRHGVLHSSPDVCDLLLEHDAGYGPGRYPPQVCPALPHPYCACPVRKVLRSPFAWRQPKPEVAAPVLVTLPEAYRILGRHLSARSGPLTRLKVERERRAANRVIRAAYESYQDLVAAG